MEFEIRIKPLVLFDLEDKIIANEQQSAGSGKEFYNNFLAQLSTLPQHHSEAIPVYQTIKEYISPDSSCRLFYMINGTTIYIMGLM